MRRYETIFISDPDISSEDRTALFERVRELIPRQQGTLIEFDEWGARRLAYEIRKKNRGYYVRIDMCGLGNLVDELERFFKIDDRVMKFMTILTDAQFDSEKLEAALKALEAVQKKPQEDMPEKDENEAGTVDDAGPETGDTDEDATENHES